MMFSDDIIKEANEWAKVRLETFKVANANPNVPVTMNAEEKELYTQLKEWGIFERWIPFRDNGMTAIHDMVALWKAIRLVKKQKEASIPKLSKWEKVVGRTRK